MVTSETGLTHYDPYHPVKFVMHISGFQHTQKKDIQSCQNHFLQSQSQLLQLPGRRPQNPKLFHSHKSRLPSRVTTLTPTLSKMLLSHKSDKPENESQEEELQITSKKIVEKVVLQAVQQYTLEKKQMKKPEPKRVHNLQTSECAK
ncbi:uncharacterized protein LOC132399251 isoform X1 [Hypanus sabinus]|uniref:uncharacterized protein LOC132399251 isoform X1 n=1 Tax=Hypanus sabinus TaxID=79690 RepID=UPI0028C4C294|nr:uncharacterized protein LOC132399251 isoform X1 [Hypanus sabinus]